MDSPPYSILLVGDHPPQLNSQAIVLGTHGYDVECVSSAAAGRQCRSTSPDLVLVGFNGRPAEMFGVAHTIQRSNPRQRIGLLIHDKQYLCSLSWDGKVIRGGEGPDDLIARVAALLRNGLTIPDCAGEAPNCEKNLHR
jgi:hypothetical protein